MAVSARVGGHLEALLATLLPQWHLLAWRSRNQTQITSAARTDNRYHSHSSETPYVLPFNAPVTFPERLPLTDLSTLYSSRTIPATLAKTPARHSANLYRSFLKHPA